MDWNTALVIVHIIGTSLGVGAATMAEILYLAFKRAFNGQTNPSDTTILQLTYRTLRVGMALLVVSGFGFLVLYRLTGETELLYSDRLWAKLTVIAVLLLGVIAWRAWRVPNWLGSAVSLASWYTALVLGAWRSLDAPYLIIMTYYLAAIVAVTLLLHALRKTFGIRA